MIVSIIISPIHLDSNSYLLNPFNLLTERSQRSDDDSDLFGLCSKDHCKAIDFVVDMIVDPSRKERKEEQDKADKVEQSRKYWLEVRRSFFS